MIPILASEYTCWDDVVFRMLRDHKDPRMQKAFFVGVDSRGRIQLVDDALMFAHCHIIGGTGGGKTSRAMLPICVQALRRRNIRVNYFDPKGDVAAFATLQETCALENLPFKWFSLESDRPGYGYFPLRQEGWAKLSITERAQIHLTATALEYGDVDPGLAYWGIANEALVREVFRMAPNAQTFGELFEIAINPEHRSAMQILKRELENSGASVAHFGRLSSIPQINGDPAKPIDGSITTAEALETPGCNYFRIPISRVPATGRAVARYFASQLIADARALGAAPVQQILALDELHHFAQRSFIDSFKQARDLRIAVIGAHQNLSDLSQGAASLIDAVLANTAVRYVFQAKDSLGQKYLKDASSPRIRLQRSTSHSSSETGAGAVSVSFGESATEIMEPSITQAEINKLNAEDGTCYIEAYPHTELTRFDGPTLIYAPHLCSPAEHKKRLERAEWPKPNEHTICAQVTDDSSAMQTIPEPPKETQAPLAAKMPKAKRGRRPKIKPSKDTPAEKKTDDLAQYLLSLEKDE